MRNRTLSRRALLHGLVLAGVAGVSAEGGAAASQRSPVLVFAAASLKSALDDVAEHWHARSGGTVRISYAGSSALARQIQYGAPADVFISANTAWMAALEKDRLIRAGTRRDLLGNRLVLIAHGGAAAPVEIAPGFDLAGRLGDGRLAMALVDAVPAGIYGKAALTTLGIWTKVAPKIAQADNARAALALVARGETPYGIVYASDALAADAVSVVATFPPGSHPPIVYPAALTADSTAIMAQAFLDHLSSPAARRLFERHGFSVIR